MGSTRTRRKVKAPGKQHAVASVARAHTARIDELEAEVEKLSQGVDTHKARAKAREQECDAAVERMEDAEKCTSHWKTKYDAANERAERLKDALRDATSREHAKHLQFTAAEQRAEEHREGANRAAAQLAIEAQRREAAEQRAEEAGAQLKRAEMHFDEATTAMVKVALQRDHLAARIRDTLAEEGYDDPDDDSGCTPRWVASLRTALFSTPPEPEETP